MVACEETYRDLIMPLTGPGYDIELFDMLMRLLRWQYEMVVLPNRNDYGYKVLTCARSALRHFNFSLTAHGQA